MAVAPLMKLHRTLVHFVQHMTNFKPADRDAIMAKSNSAVQQATHLQPHSCAHAQLPTITTVNDAHLAYYQLN